MGKYSPLHVDVGLMVREGYAAPVTRGQRYLTRPPTARARHSAPRFRFIGRFLLMGPRKPCIRRPRERRHEPVAVGVEPPATMTCDNPNYRVDNPAANLKRLLPKQRSHIRHHPSLPHDEAREVLAEWLELPVREPVRLVVLFIVLTAARLSEATRATWGEIDLTRVRWQVPGERMKSGEAHTVPLSVQALDVLKRAKELKGDGSLVFPVVDRYGKVRPPSQGMVGDALRKLGRLDEKKQRIVMHGFRATFRGFTIEIAGAVHEVCEAALAHGESDVTVKSYTRDADPFAFRTELMQKWADYVLPWPVRFGDG